MAQNLTNNRAPSRASTASLHSTTTQPQAQLQQHPQHIDQAFAGPQAVQQMYTEPWAPNGHGQGRDMAAAVHQMAAADAMLRPASRMQPMNPHQTFAVDTSMHSSFGHPMQHPQHPGMQHHSLAGDSFGANTSFTEHDSQMMEGDENEDVNSLAGVAVNSKPSSNKTSANNELEMRSLFQASKHRTLQDVATELHGNERGPNSERQRQVFAMLWYVTALCLAGVDHADRALQDQPGLFEGEGLGSSRTGIRQLRLPVRDRAHHRLEPGELWKVGSRIVPRSKDAPTGSPRRIKVPLCQLHAG